MIRGCFGFMLTAGIGLALTSTVSAGQLAGIARTDGQPLETGPFDSHSTAAGPEITHEFQSMYLTSQPNTWTKTFRWEIPANTGLVPGATLSIMESIPLIYPNSSTGSDRLHELRISDWHETITDGDLSDFLQWDSQSSNTSISARIGSEEIPIHAHVSFSSDDKSIWFDFDPIHIPIQDGMSSTPVTLDIWKRVRWIGPVLDPLPSLHHIDVLVNEYPTAPGPVGDYNDDGIVDGADYVLWRTVDGTPNDYDTWRAHFGEMLGQATAGPSNVPEPSTLLLLAFAALPAFSPRRRKSVPHNRV